jgi:hypothetical protein
LLPQTTLCEILFFITQPFGSIRKIRHKGNNETSAKNCDDTLNNEKPLVASQITFAIEKCHAIGDAATKTTGKCGRRRHDTDTERALLWSIPGSYNIDNTLSKEV